MRTGAGFPALLQSFFPDRLVRQRKASAHTIAGYRDYFRLLLRFAAARLGKGPSNLLLEDLNAPFLGEFLDYIETARHNGARTRNVRLAAIHSFFRYVSFFRPGQADLCAIRRDDIVLGTGAHVRCEGKGRKQRCTPLRQEAAKVMEAWLRECPGEPQAPVFPSSRGRTLSRDAVEHLVARHCNIARRRCPSLRRKHGTPHVLRPTAAIALLQHGLDRSVIALWLGHASGETPQMYLHADLRLNADT